MGYLLMPSLLLPVILIPRREFEILEGKQGALRIVSASFEIPALAKVAIGILPAMPQSGMAFMVKALNSFSKFLGLRQKCG